MITLFYSEWPYAVSNKIRMKRIHPIWNTQGENDIVRICDIIVYSGLCNVGEINLIRKLVVLAAALLQTGELSPWRVGKRAGWVVPNLTVVLSMMSPVEPSLPHACLNPGAQQATLFPMQLSTMSACTVPPLPTTWFTRRITLAESSTLPLAHMFTRKQTHPRQWHKQLLHSQCPFCKTCFARWRCLCSGKSAKKFRFTGKIRWVWVCAFHRKRSSVFTKLSCMQQGKGHIESDTVITTTTAPPAGG